MFRRVLILGVAALGLLSLWQWITWPDVADLARTAPATTAFIETHRRATGEPPRQVWVPYDRISNSLKQAVVVAEDIDFFAHQGFAIDEMKIALRETVEQGRPLRGASTITQQLAKNLWLSPSRNPWRKAKEYLLTVQLERHLSKRRILELYLNFAQFGPDVFGAEAAARHYFGASAATLTEGQAAQLAAGLSRPRSWNPSASSPGYQRRVGTLIARMRQARWVLGEL